MIRRISMVFAMAAALLVATPLSAAEPNQGMVEQYRAELTQYREAIGADVAQKDIEMVAKWLEEAEVLLANGDESAAKRRLKRVEFGLDMVRAIVAAEQVRKAAEDQEAAAYTAPETTEKLKADIEKLLQEKRELESQLKSLK